VAAEIPVTVTVYKPGVYRLSCDGRCSDHNQRPKVRQPEHR